MIELWRIVRDDVDSREAMEVKQVIAMLLTTTLVGCAMTGDYARDPNGQPVYYIDSMSAWVAHRTADSMCPSGYNIVGDALQTSPLDYEMTVQCKP